jgi:phage shock protein PspC (stress-responsive transcriptional regulator)
MNKTVTINISGIIFHIDEDAYEKLSKYLSTIKGYFRDSEGRDEIVSDIESRIAEMLQERISPTKQVVLLTDVDHVMSIMGKPEEFAGGEADENTGKREEAATEPTGSNRRRRLFRDPDDKMLGGVCSGIGHYFDVDPLWLRLALAFCLCAFGFGFFLYILLWIIIPQAKTTADRLEMRGEKVNINNIHRNFTDEMGDLKNRMNDLKEEASKFGSPENREKMRKGAGKLGDFLEDFFRMFGKVIGKIFAAFLIFLSIILLISILASIFGVHTSHIQFGGQSMSAREFIHLFFNSGRLSSLSLLTVILLVAIPAFMLLYSGVRILFGLGKRNKILTLVTFLLWCCGIGLGGYIACQAASEFSESSRSRHCVAIKPVSNTLYLKMSKPGSGSDEFESSSHHTWNDFHIYRHHAFNYYPSLDIVPSASDSFEICIMSTANGATEQEAQVRASHIQYNYSQKDSVLEFDPAFSFAVEDKWRNQQVYIVIKVPKNKMVYMANNLKPLLYDTDIDNLQRTDADEMVGRKWIMTEEGLSCVDCRDLDLLHHSRRHHRHSEDPDAPQPPSPPQPPAKRAVYTFF